MCSGATTLRVYDISDLLTLEFWGLKDQHVHRFMTPLLIWVSNEAQALVTTDKSFARWYMK